MGGNIESRVLPWCVAILLLHLAWSAPLAAQYYAIDPEPVPSRLGEAVAYGSGPDTLLLIPCASCRWRSFDEFMERNAERYTMWAVTLPGYGGTQAPDLPMWSDSTVWRDHAVDAISDLIDEQGISGAVVIGASYGTTVAIELAARRPDVVRGMINLDGSFNNPPEQDTLPLSVKVQNARETMEQYALPLRDPDRWQPFNTPAIYHRTTRRLLYHGWFMATDPDVMMQYWRENLLSDGNRAFESLDVPFLDIRALRPWDETREETRRGVEDAMAAIDAGDGYNRIFLYDTPHFIMEERPALLDSLVARFVAGERLQDYRPPETGLVGLAPPEVREDFAAGVRALHNFWYGEAERRFRRVRAGAPTFTLGYWGEALSLHRGPFGHSEPPVDSMRAVLHRLAPTAASRSRRVKAHQELLYLDALEILIADEGTPGERHPAYVEAMERLADLYPHDVEALAFFARALFLRDSSFSHSPDVRRDVAEASRRVLAVEPNHPGGLHYLIHGLDTPETADEALPAADRYAKVAAGAPHAIHMPSHIYVQLGRWDDAIRSNRAALDASLAWLENAGRPEAQLDVHAMDFLVYALLQQGREAEVRRLLAKMRRLDETYDSGTIRWMNALFHARYAMETGSRSDVPLPRSGYTSRGELLALGLHAAGTGDLERARSLLDEMEERMPEDPSATWRIARLELQAAVAAAEGTPERAVSLLREAILLQEELPRPNETPDPEKPPEEFLGEILLELDRPVDAERAFAAGAARWPGRLATRLGMARAAAARGDEAMARERYRVLLDQLEHASDDHPAVLEARRVLTTE